MRGRRERKLTINGSFAIRGIRPEKRRKTTKIATDVVVSGMFAVHYARGLPEQLPTNTSAAAIDKTLSSTFYRIAPYCSSLPGGIYAGN